MDNQVLCIKIIGAKIFYQSAIDIGDDMFYQIKITIDGEEFKTQFKCDSSTPTFDELFKYTLKLNQDGSFVKPESMEIVLMSDTKSIAKSIHDISMANEISYIFAKDQWIKLESIQDICLKVKSSFFSFQKSKNVVKKSPIIHVGIRIGTESFSKRNSKIIEDSILKAKPIKNHEMVKLSDIINETDDVVDLMFESTERSKRLITETKNIANLTTDKMVNQGEKLRSVEEKIFELNIELKEGERQLRSIKSVFGQMYNSMKSDKVNSKYKPLSRKELEKYSITIENTEFGSDKLIKEGYFDHLSKDTLKKITQSEQNLQFINSSIAELKQIAINLGREIDEQNIVLDHISPNVKDSKVKIQDLTRQTKNLIK
jgi:synaptosomal-associated protein 29